MLRADQARALSDSTDKVLRSRARDKALKELNIILPDILKRIEEAANRDDEAIYSIDISSNELHCIQKTTVLQDLGYKVGPCGIWPWDGFISW